ncbi:TBC1 domain family member 19-like [Dysidea avara]|uniref:TBC1 domain family member 19-like n=1 Tax=Dysidea avara TaxID=196820 RepID=UPI003325A8E8
MDDHYLHHVEDIGLACHIKRNLKAAVLATSVKNKDIKKVALETFKSTELEVHVKNALYKEYMKLKLIGIQNSSDFLLRNNEAFGDYGCFIKEPVDFIEEVQTKWSTRLRQAINRMSAQFGVPLSKQRTGPEQEYVLSQWGSLSQMLTGGDVKEFRPLFTAKDIFEILCTIRNPNLTEKAMVDLERWKMLPLNITVKSLQDLKIQFEQLDPKLVQLDSAAYSSETAEDEVLLQTSKVIKKGLYAAARFLCRYGCPTGNRFELWRMAFCIDFSGGKHVLHFEKLKQMVIKYKFLFDSILLQDLKNTVANDDNYFVFEDLLYQILFTFLRDTEIQEIGSYAPVDLPMARTKRKVGISDREVVYPPSGVIPIHGFSYYIAPLCFTQANPIPLYVVFSAMYKRYLFHLHTISSHPNSLLSLCCLFEDVLQQKNPTLVLHLKSIKAEPLKLAYKWILYAFSGYLDPDQVLLLWDRIVGFDSLEIVPILAAAVFHFRATSLLHISSLAEAEGVLGNLHTLKVLPLMQHMLFLD